MKKGQITLFIIIGVILILAISTFFIFFNNNVEQDLNTVSNQESSNLNLFVEDCLSETLKKGLYEIGMLGGFRTMPLANFFSEYGEAAYHYYQGLNLAPTIEDVQQNLEDYIYDEIQYCFMNFIEFKNMGYEVETGDLNVNVILAQEDVSVNLNYPINLIQNEERINLNNFNTRTNVKLRQVWELGNEIINLIVEEPLYIHSTEILYLMEEYDMQVNSVLFEEEGAVVYIIEDYDSIIWPDVHLVYIFVSEIDTTDVPPVILLDQFEYYTIVNEELNINIEAYDPNGNYLTYYVSGEHASIGLYSGNLNFLSDEEGVFNLIVNVSDGIYNSTIDLIVNVGDEE